MKGNWVSILILVSPPLTNLCSIAGVEDTKWMRVIERSISKGKRVWVKYKLQTIGIEWYFVSMRHNYYFHLYVGYIERRRKKQSKKSFGWLKWILFTKKTVIMKSLNDCSKILFTMGWHCPWKFCLWIGFFSLSRILKGLGLSFFFSVLCFSWI